MAGSSPWVVCPRPNPHASARIFCVPFAGGGVASYRGWADLLPEFELSIVHLPGRETRRHEPACASFDEAARSAADEILPFIDRPYALFGHSMGALLAFEVARHLTAANRPPIALGVSGRRGASLPETREPIGMLPMDAFLDRVRQRYGGVPAVILEDPELRALLVPVLQGDIRLIESYTYHAHPARLSCPILAYGGTSDQHASIDELKAWARETSGPSSVRQFPGGHFYLQPERDGLVAAFRDACRHALITQAQAPRCAAS